MEAQRGGAMGSAWVSIRKGGLNQKVEPSPGRLSTPMEPPISFTSCLEIARPRPGAAELSRGGAVHLAELFEEAGRCSPGRSRPGVAHARSASGAVRLAGSRTQRRSAPGRRSVNLTALPTRLVTTWRMRPRIADEVARQLRRISQAQLDLLIAAPWMPASR